MSYFPFDISTSPVEFGLEKRRVATALGKICVRTNPAFRRSPVVFLHGIGMDWSSWTPILNAADAQDLDRRSWIFVDVPGFGESDPIGGPVTLAIKPRGWLKRKSVREMDERLLVTEKRALLLQERGFPLGSVWRKSPEILLAAMANLGLLVTLAKIVLDAL